MDFDCKIWLFAIHWSFSAFFFCCFLVNISETLKLELLLWTPSPLLWFGGRGIGKSIVEMAYDGVNVIRMNQKKNHIHINCKYYLFVVSVFDEWWELLMFLFATFSDVSRSKENNVSSWTLLLAGWLAVRQAGRQAS